MANPVVLDKAAAGFVNQVAGSTPHFATASGMAVYVAVASNSRAPTSISDSVGATYSQIAQGVQGGSILTLYAADNVGGSAGNQVTVAFASPTDFVVAAVSFVNVPNPSLDVAGFSNTAVSNSASSSVTTTAGNDLVLMAARTDGSPSLSPSSDTLIVTAKTGNGSIALGLFYQNAGAAGAYTTSASLSSVVRWVSISVGVLLGAVTPLSAAASGSPGSGVAPLLVSFLGAGAGGTPPYTYAWAFGDGGVSGLQNPSHTYLAKGTYVATLTVTDSVPNTANASVTTKVVAPNPSTKSNLGLPKARVRPTPGGSVTSRKTQASA